jgi:hypothetical protein
MYSVLCGLTLSGIVILSILHFVDNSFELFRNEWQNCIFFGTILSFCLLFSLLCIDAFLLYRKRKILNITLHENESWWCLAKQKDGSFATQLSIKVNLGNISDSPISILKVRLIKPKILGRVFHSVVFLPKEGCASYSNDHKIPSRATVKASIEIMVEGIFVTEKKKLKVVLGITDEFGTEHRLKGIINST